eukprot:Tamp_23123.p1 GENE.Tamp_23123~~Tamp_23123.p1  ORF type:complete len:258 (-),score=18.74 Tamp_23123:88-861(-)
MSIHITYLPIQTRKDVEEEIGVSNKTAQDIAKEWGFQDPKVAEMMLRKRLKYQKLAREKEKRGSLLDPEHRLARFKRVAAAAAQLPAHVPSPRSEHQPYPTNVVAGSAHEPVPPQAREISSPAGSAASTDSRPSSQARPIATPTRHVRSKFVARSREAAPLALRGSIADVTRASATLPSSSAISELMNFQTQTLNQKLVRGQKPNSRGNATKGGSGGGVAAGGAGLSVEGHGGVPGGAGSAGAAQGPSVRVNNFFLS